MADSYRTAEALARARSVADAPTLTVLAKRFKRSVTWCSRTLHAYQQAGPELKQAWRDGRVTQEIAQALAARPHFRQQIALVTLEVLPGRSSRRASAGLSHPRRQSSLETLLASGERLTKHTPSEYDRGVLDALRYALGQHVVFRAPWKAKKGR
jgi:hypothetical protein